LLINFNYTSIDDFLPIFELPTLHQTLILCSQVYLLASAAESEKFISSFQEAAKGFKGKVAVTFN